MGRNCGEIAVHTAVDCGAEFVLVPEVEWTVEEIATRMKWARLRGKKSTIIILAEGAMSSLKTDVPTLCSKYEELHDIAKDVITGSKLAMMLETISGQETRNTVLGYIQRGGAPSALDRQLGAQFGHHAVKLMKDGQGGRAVGIRAHKMIDVPFDEVIGVRRPLNQEMMDLVRVLANG